MDQNQQRIDPTGINMIASAATRANALLNMLSLYLHQASDGGDTLPPGTLDAIVWQAQINMADLEEGIEVCSDALNLKNDGERGWKVAQ